MNLLRPIRSQADHDAALAEIERLWGAAEGSAESDRLELLTLMVEDYESKRWPIEQADPIETLHHLLAEGEHSQAELAGLIGSRSRASEILARKRPLTLAMIRKISAAWKLPAALLIQPYELTGRAA